MSHTNQTVKVSLISIGRCDTVIVAAGTTLADLIRVEDIALAPDWDILVNGRPAADSRQLRDGGVVIYTFPIVAAANIEQGTGRDGVKVLRDFTRRASTLTIVDPFLFNCCSTTEDEYTEMFVSATSIDVAPRRLALIFGPKNNNREAKKQILHACTELRCDFTLYKTGLIHDRYWIRDDAYALHVGTSLNGMGSRYSTISRLAADDLKGFLHWLEGNVIQRGRLG